MPRNLIKSFDYAQDDNFHMKIVTISGLDGSGKSTQIQMLKKYLEAQGKRVYYFHAVEFGIGNKIISSLKNICYILLRSKQNVASQKSITKAGWTGIRLRKIALKIDLIRFKGLIKKLEKQGFDCILSDRYFYDSLVNIFYLEGLSEAKLLEKKLSFYNIYQPEIAIYLKVDPETIMQRKRIPDQGLEYLQKKNALYFNTSNNWNFVTVDGNKDKEIIFEEIKKLLNST